MQIRCYPPEHRSTSLKLGGADYNAHILFLVALPGCAINSRGEREGTKLWWLLSFDA